MCNIWAIHLKPTKVSTNKKINITTNNTNIRPKGIHSGDNTHHHDQEMTFVNFSTTNTIVNIEAIGKLVEVAILFFDIFPPNDISIPPLMKNSILIIIYLKSFINTFSHK